MSEELAVVEHGLDVLSPTDVVRQVALIQQVMSGVMKEGEHFGKIPGCGDKPTLLQPGAQVLALTFRLAPRFTIDERHFDGGHREFLITCELYSIGNGQLVGMGVGMASTMESKWRFRTGPVEFTGKAVPPEYWDLRKDNPAKALDLLGGRGHQVKKNPDTASWEIARAGEKVENENPADVYNTALKIAAKRAFVGAVLNTTAASDMFTQDIEDMPVDAPMPQAEPRAGSVILEQIRALRDALGVDQEKYIEQLAWAQGAPVSSDTDLTARAAAKLLDAYDDRKAHLDAERVASDLGAEVKF
jgi:hypothetical protein